MNDSLSLRSSCFSGLMLLAACLVICRSAAAQPADTANEPAGEAENLALQLAQAAVEELQGIELKVGSEQAPCPLLPQPALRWSNPTDGEVYGVVHFWTSAGRPVAVTSVYQMFDQRGFRQMEMVTLTGEPLSATRDSSVIWQLAGGSVEYRPLPEAPGPAGSARARLLQMRSLARKFSAEMATRDDPDDFSQLRLMSKPLLQYATTDDTAAKAEGAVFALVSTTDPEVLLLLESRGSGDKREWMYAAARMHFARLRMSYGGKQVWEAEQVAPPWTKVNRPEAPYRIRNWPGVQLEENR